ncbi:BTAD domain-containing putative transcriptional regulator [Kineosporia sp. NBRC 101731]|uniref:AfsR/SARP family transcriptional regulator n=1 Tax=Kineosporia sp. NBRC 101731 TaxID=3032199 RepID=UPI0024A5BFEB|nr:BTAD domain-containing putative transcriptional regulator [Kineosporia sp. NBRC 101731]GLY28873.1 SARP family transcriptional regulator [Kineosporia sp. NBRC 101731]
MSQGTQEPPTEYWFQLLGPLRFWRDGVEIETGPRQQRCLLALLLARAGQPVGVSEMVDVLWGDEPTASAVNVIHRYIGALRRLTEPGLAARGHSSWLVRQGNSYRLTAGAEASDVVAFRDLVERARTLSRDHDYAPSLDLYQKAIELWSGPCAADLADSGPATAVFHALNRQLFDVAMEAADLAMRLGLADRLLPALRRVASWDHLNEPLHAQLMTLLHEAGHRAEAFAVHDTLRTRLDEELGLEPGPECRAVQQRLLTGTPAVPDPSGERPEPTYDELANPPASLVVRPAQLPPDLPVFVGREDETQVVTGLLQRRHDEPQAAPLVIALSGMGGVGKSTFAVHLAHLLAPGHADGQLYLDLRGSGDGEQSVSTGEALTLLLHSLGMPAVSVPEQVPAQVGMYRSLTVDKRMIVLLDNAHTVQQVRPLVPNSAQSLVLVTSRAPLAGLAAVEGARLLLMDLPTAQIAREILLARLPATGQTPDPAVVDEIVELCGRLPLALALVAAQMAARPWFSLQAVADGLRDAPRLEAFGHDETNNDPRSVFAWSYRHLGPEAARLFRYLSIRIGPSISASACASLLGTELATTRALLQELAGSALISEVEPGRYSSHVLVRAYAEELFLEIDSPQERQEAGTRLLQHYQHSSFAAHVAVRPHLRPVPPLGLAHSVHPESPAGFHTAMSWFATERPVLVDAVTRATERRFGVESWRLALTLQQYFQRGAFFQDWMNVMSTALQAARRDEDRAGQAYSLRSLAGAHFFFGRYDEALDLLDEAGQLFTEMGFPEERGYVHTNRGDVLIRLKRHEEALAEYQKAHRQFVTSGNAQREVRAMSEVGHTLALLGDNAEAETQLRSALARNDQVGNLEQEGQIRVYIGRLQTGLKDYRSAIKELEDAVLVLNRVGHRTLEFDALLMIIESWLALEDYDSAWKTWHTAHELAQTWQNGGTLQTAERLDRLRPPVEPEGV